MIRLAERFRVFAGECEGTSPLYRALSLMVAEDDELLALAAHAPPQQPTPNLFFSAVHHLLLQGRPHPLSAFYASLTSFPEDPEGAAEPFRNFARSHEGEIREILTTRLVQTNEVRRSIYLAAALREIASELDGRGMFLVELGASAGLNLLLDRYRYRFGEGPAFGAAVSPLLLTSELRGPGVPPVGAVPPSILGRIGLDLNPIESDDEEGLRWLVALTWPEHTERRERLRLAISILRDHPLPMVAGDGVAALPGVLSGIPARAVPVVFHTHVANQLSDDGRRDLLDTMDRFGAHRDAVHLHHNIEPHLHATIYRAGERKEIPLARVDGHARWVEWLVVRGR